MTRFYDDRAPPSPPRRRSDFRAKHKCPDCDAEPGEVHAADCGMRSKYIG